MESPEISASFLSRWTLWWLRDLLQLQKTKPIEKEDLYKLIPERTSEVLLKNIEHNANLAAITTTVP